jgi:hypothetical protein
MPSTWMNEESLHPHAIVNFQWRVLCEVNEPLTFEGHHVFLEGEMTYDEQHSILECRWHKYESCYKAPKDYNQMIKVWI